MTMSYEVRADGSEISFRPAVMQYTGGPGAGDLLDCQVATCPCSPGGGHTFVVLLCEQDDNPGLAPIHFHFLCTVCKTSYAPEGMFALPPNATRKQRRAFKRRS